MKTLNMLFAATALTLTAGLAHADVRPDHIADLLSSGQVAPFEKLNQAALALHPGATILDTELDHSYGKLVYEVELQDVKGVRWDVDLNAKTAEVLQNKHDT